MTGDCAALVLGEQPVTPEDVVAVAAGRPVELGATARQAMTRSREVLERALDRGDAIYGVTRGVGALKTVAVKDDEQEPFNRALLISHRVGHGDLAPPQFARAAMVACAAETLCAALNAGLAPRLHMIGSVGQADLSQMAEIGLALTGETIAPEVLRAAG